MVKKSNPKKFEDETKITDKKKVIIIGGGPNRIGQGIEFDYCCVHSSFAIREMKIESIMINCNPETVSTDFDISDRLYFEPLDSESVLKYVMQKIKRKFIRCNSSIRRTNALKLAEKSLMKN